MATPSRPTRTGSAGPADSGALFGYAVAGHDDGGLRSMARQFAGAYRIGSPRVDPVGTSSIGYPMGTGSAP
jgi:hypothetical protein